MPLKATSGFSGACFFGVRPGAGLGPVLRAVEHLQLYLTSTWGAASPAEAGPGQGLGHVTRILHPLRPASSIAFVTAFAQPLSCRLAALGAGGDFYQRGNLPLGVSTPAATGTWHYHKGSGLCAPPRWQSESILFLQLFIMILVISQH